MKASEVLREAKALPYTFGEYAQDAAGNVVEATDVEAVCFCAYGAVGRVLGENPEDWLDGGDPEALKFLREAAGGNSPMNKSDRLKDYPDERLAWWELAIALAEEAESAA